MKRIFRTRTFSRWMKKTGLVDADLSQSVTEMEAGLIDADLGGHVVKKRVALPGHGKRGSARTIVATNKGDRWYFIFGFDKNERANIDRHELRALQELASDLLAQDAAAIAAVLKAGELVEIAMTKKIRESRILAEVRETAVGLHHAGMISKRRMHEYDALSDLAVPAIGASKIKSIRENSKLSQAVFAAVLNTSISTVQKWEIGEKKPSGPSLKLLSLIDRKGLEAVL